MPPVKRVTGRELVRALKQRRWRVDRVRGSITSCATRTTLAVPVHGSTTLPIGTQLSVLKDAGVDAVEFNELV
jgi:predicted RNA binding protein YcfA (HicA-like mRNA interferase family)